ncbi:hypothetical protein D0Z06_14915 [Geodermatophilus marinus]|nr:hypothetical protein D0Z06_14915 [Geodermatophilus sp. LHW52908]
MWALLLLAAVFSMHGVQCMAADMDAGHGTAASAMPVVHGVASAEFVWPALTVVGYQSPGVVPGAGPVAAISGPPHDSPSTSGTAFGAVCLAVLLTGVVLLGVAALIRRVPGSVVRARAPSVLWHAWWSRLPRPPDLSALCLLRI